MDPNKVRSLHCHLRVKYGMESVELFCKWEFLVKIISDYQNHRRFTLRYIKADITPISCKLKNPVKTLKSHHIIHRAEKQLLHERVRNINNILYLREFK